MDILISISYLPALLIWLILWSLQLVYKEEEVHISSHGGIACKIIQSDTCKSDESNQIVFHLQMMHCLGCFRLRCSIIRIFKNRLGFVPVSVSSKPHEQFKDIPVI